MADALYNGNPVWIPKAGIHFAYKVKPPILTSPVPGRVNMPDSFSLSLLINFHTNPAKTNIVLIFGAPEIAVRTFLHTRQGFPPFSLV